MPAQLSKTRQLLIAAVLVCAAAILWFGYGAVSGMLGGADQITGGKRGERLVPVLVARVGQANDDLTLEAVGTGRANRSITLRSETSGQIAEMPLTAGRRFAAGELLLRIDDKEERLAVTLAETRLADARRTQARLQKLRGRGAASTSSLDAARTAAQIAAIELERAGKELTNHSVTAPFDGVAGLPEIELGAWIESGDAIASFDDRSTILVGFDLPEALLSRVRIGMPVAATTASVADTPLEGAVVAIDSRIAANSRTVRVRVALPNAEDRLRPGASFAIRLELPGDRFPIVPELAVQFTRGSLLVWRVRDDRVEEVPVRMVRRRQGEVLVDGPLAEGDLVVIEGTQRLQPGRKVNVLNTSEAGSS